MDKLYSVVEFTTEKSVSLVPKIWLQQENTVCAWPKWKGQKLTKTIKQRTEPEPDWSLHPIRLLKSLDNYEKGLKLAEEAEDTSGLDSQSEVEVQLPKRRGKTTQRSDFNYSDSDSIPNRAETTTITNEFPEPSGNLLKSETEAIDERLLFVNSIDGNLILSSVALESPDVSHLEPVGEGSPASGSESSSSLIYTNESSLSQPGSINSGLDDSISLVSAAQFRLLNSKFEDFQTTVANQLVNIQDGIRDITHQNAASGCCTPSSGSSILDFLPLESQEELKNFEGLLNDESRNILVKYLGSVGGSNQGDVTRQILKKLFSRSFAVHFNYTGSNNKVAIRNSALYKLVIDSTRRHFKHSTIEEIKIKKSVIDWCRGAKEKEMEAGSKSRLCPTVSAKTKRRRIVKAAQLLLSSSSPAKNSNINTSAEEDNGTTMGSRNVLEGSSITEDINSDFERFSSDEEDGCSNSFNLHEELVKWSLHHNITHVAISSLLKLLKTCFPELNLPKDSRTLLKTPAVVSSKRMGDGEYYYFGIQSNVKIKISKGLRSLTFPILSNLYPNIHNLLSISINVDGLPIARSSNKQFWPVLGVLDQSLDKSPFEIALYLGKTKPKDVQEFLYLFEQEMKELETNGIIYNSVKYHLVISRIIADAPARSFVKQCKLHNAYNGCERCVQEGEWLNRVVLLNNDCRLRTDADFKAQTDPDHHVGNCPLSTINLGLVSQVVLDPMHLLFLGVTRKLIITWVRGSIPHKLPAAKVNSLNVGIFNISRYVPAEFCRKPRSLRELDHFKATEYRLFLLYTGPVVLKAILPTAQYTHFLLLHSAAIILVSKLACNIEWNSLARQLLNSFVCQAVNLYGKEYLVYNVHSLIHLPADALNFGPIDSFSAFPFENRMQFKKKIVRGKKLELQQVVKRILEREVLADVTITSDPDNGTIKLYSYKGVNKLQYKGYLFCNQTGDNCFMTRELKIIIISEIVLNESVESKYLIVCKAFSVTKNADNYPISSAKLGIYVCDYKYLSLELIVPITDVLRKCVLLPLDDLNQKFMCVSFPEDI